MRPLRLLLAAACLLPLGSALSVDTGSVQRVEATRLRPPEPILITVEITPAPTAVATPRPTRRPAASVAPVRRAVRTAEVAQRPATTTSAALSATRTAAPTARPTARPTAKPTPKPTPTASPATTPKATPVGRTYTRDEVKAAIRSSWGGDDEDAISVAQCESMLDPNATNGPYLGLWQMTSGTWKSSGGSGDDPRNHGPAEQTRVAYNLFKAQGWGPWPGCAPG